MISSKTTMQLKFDMQVLASTCIKRKKPWSQLAIIGKVCFHLFFKLSYLKILFSLISDLVYTRKQMLQQVNLCDVECFNENIQEL